MEAFLTEFPGVKKVTAKSLGDNLVGFEIEPERGQDLREPLAKKVIEKGWSLRRLDVRRKGLDAVYADVVLSRDS